MDFSMMLRLIGSMVVAIMLRNILTSRALQF